jgi:hypothetical protein
MLEKIKLLAITVVMSACLASMTAALAYVVWLVYRCTFTVYCPVLG